MKHMPTLPWFLRGLAVPILGAQAAATKQPAVPVPPLPTPDSLTIESWADLKTTMDTVGSEVQEVLSVRNDIGMLQEDLAQQEQTWHKAETDLQFSVAALKAKADQVHTMAALGASVRGRVAHLKDAILKETQHARALTKTYTYDQQKASLAETVLERRVDELRRRLALLKADGEQRLDEARIAAANTTNQTVKIERQATMLQDLVKDQREALRVEQAMAKDKAQEIRNRIDSMRVTMTGLRSQLMAPGAMEAAVKAMEAQVEQETQALVAATTAKEQAQQECEARQAETTNALLAEQSKASERHIEMGRVCDAAIQRKALLESILKEVCVPAQVLFVEPTTTAPQVVEDFGVPAPAPLPMPVGQM